MAFTAPERQKIEKSLRVFMEKQRSPVELRSELDFQCRISKKLNRVPIVWHDLFKAQSGTGLGFDTIVQP